VPAQDQGFIRTQSIQEIEYLRRLYAKATDMIGEANQDSIQEGRKIYHRIFAEDAVLSTGTRNVIGPDAWVDLVLGVLKPLGPTQHLIGTQLVDIDHLVMNEDGEVLSGSASMESYVQAWHERPDKKVWLYLGTYIDKVTFIGDIGWQIVAMKMKQSGGEIRYMDEAVAKAT